MHFACKTLALGYIFLNLMSQKTFGLCRKMPAIPCRICCLRVACVSGSGLYSMQYTRRCPMIATFVTMGVGSCLMEGYVNYKLGASPCGGDKNTSEL